MHSQPKQFAAQPQVENNCFDERELECENLHCLQSRCAAAAKSVDEAMDMYGFSRHFAELLASLTSDEIERLSKSGFSLLELDSERFTGLMRSIDNPNLNAVTLSHVAEIEKEKIITETRGALVRRWHLIHIARIEAMRRLDVTANVATLLRQATYDNIDKISNLGIPLFKLTENASLVNLAKLTQSSKDLAILTVLRD